MTDQSYLEQVFGGLFGVDADDTGVWATAEHRQYDQPAHTALLHRTFPTYTEVMWIQVYPHVQRITVTHPAVAGLPGCVRDIPIGWREMRSAETLRSKFERIVDSYLGQGWTSKECEVR